MKKKIAFGLLVLLAILGTACKAQCPPERISYQSDLTLFPPQQATDPVIPTWIEIKGKPIAVDRVISGPVCNENWSGAIYVTCDIQIPFWERDPFFFQDCDFDVAEGTQVYVEAHNDKLYTEGCSCHE